ncbi:MAG: aminoglycoside phosphotransferase family protein [Akkermansiaceae bacterium]|nr:aminoglycoside phosphotransferase family protein [Akkermansiaceae bacterium]
MPKPRTNHDVESVCEMFDIRADFKEARPYGNGHINDTYLTRCDQAGLQTRFIVQRINHHVFKDPVSLMENVSRVTKHALETLLDQNHPEAHRRTLTCIPTLEGNQPYARDVEGNFWRVYPFIERARGYDELTCNKQAYQAARAFGRFQNLAASLGGKRLHETIPDFHHTPKRLEALEQAIADDPMGRAAEVQAEIDFARARAEDCPIITDKLASGEIPERITHNDTKINNVLLDEVTSAAICVLDLDTTMPGSALYDFGDMVRSCTPTAPEDETDLESIGIQLDRFEALVKGYLSAAHFLNSSELELMAFSGKLLTLECGMRFLTDYLQGDHYFKIHHPGHNLERCRSQFAFVGVIEKHLPQMDGIVEKCIQSNLRLGQKETA